MLKKVWHHSSFKQYTLYSSIVAMLVKDDIPLTQTLKGGNIQAHSISIS